jgi:MSHA biogenesis protein MshJ
MNQYWQHLVTRVDALSLRERFIIFVMLVLVLITAVNAFLLNPLYAKQKILSEQIKQDRAKSTAIQQELLQKVKASAMDPDEANRAHLVQLKAQLEKMQNALVDMQKGLVPPEKMAALLEDILKHNGQLRLLSLRTLPVTMLNEPEASAAKAGAAKTEASTASASQSASDKQQEKAAGAIYKHGVEITVQGRYLDMMDYMTQLESMPWQVFWGKAKLSVDEYPKATLTLTLYTLSLDKKWLQL